MQSPPRFERRTNSIRFGFGSWRIALLRDSSAEFYLPWGWTAYCLTPEIVWMRRGAP